MHSSCYRLSAEARRCRRDRWRDIDRRSDHGRPFACLAKPSKLSSRPRDGQPQPINHQCLVSDYPILQGHSSWPKDVPARLGTTPNDEIDRFVTAVASLHRAPWRRARTNNGVRCHPTLGILRSTASAIDADAPMSERQYDRGCSLCRCRSHISQTVRRPLGSPKEGVKSHPKDLS